MNYTKSILAVMCAFAVGGAAAQQPAKAPAGKAAPAKTGVERMQSIMDAMKNGDPASLPAQTQRAIETGLASGEKAGDLQGAPQSTVDLAVKTNEEWLQMSKEAYVAALPPRDRARGAALLLGDGTLPGSEGKLFIFVSRSMPMAMLRAYALDALYTGATLVTKGIRKGDTIKEYIEEAVGDFNNAEGQVLAAMEVNPNLFDMFKIEVVPTVVWTNRAGLEDVGSGCQPIPEGQAIPQVQLTGADDRPVMVDRPACAPVSPTSYYKIAGALTLPYVLERFEDSGLSKKSTAPIKAALADRRASAAHDGSQAQLGNSIQPINGDIRIQNMPKHVLSAWKELLATSHVQRGPNGPAFSEEGEDDPVYRAELEGKVRHGLGL